MMRYAALLFVCSTLLCSGHAQASDLPTVLTVRANRYTLGPGDKLKLTLFDQREFDSECIVDVSGNISVPLLGSVHASGHSLVELSRNIEQALITDDFYLSPHVTIALQQARPFMIEGDVAKPGGYPYEADLTVRRAFVWAGGFASTPKMSLIIGLKASTHGSNNTVPVVTIFRNINGFDEKIDADENSLIIPGDIVNVKYSLSFLTKLHSNK